MECKLKEVLSQHSKLEEKTINEKMMKSNKNMAPGYEKKTAQSGTYYNIRH